MVKELYGINTLSSSREILNLNLTRTCSGCSNCNHLGTLCTLCCMSNSLCSLYSHNRQHIRILNTLLSIGKLHFNQLSNHQNMKYTNHIYQHSHNCLVTLCKHSQNSNNSQSCIGCRHHKCQLSCSLLEAFYNLSLNLNSIRSCI